MHLHLKMQCHAALHCHRHQLEPVSVAKPVSFVRSNAGS